jgi:ketosteroid isomerase-like protein
VEHTRRALEAFNRDGPEAAAAFLDPDVEWHDLPDQPDSGVHYGREGYLAAMEQWLLPFEDYRHEIVEIIDLGDQVVVCLRIVGRGGGSGVEFEQSAAGVWTFRDGSIVRVRWFIERDAALEVAGRRE